MSEDVSPTPSRWARRRAKRREAGGRRADLAEALTAWREERRAAAAKAHHEKRKADLKARAGHRGVDRVPVQLRDAPSVTVAAHEESEPRFRPDGSTRRGGRRIVTEDRPAGNHAVRRARGQRGHRRRLRRREVAAMGAANRLPDADLVQQRAATRARRDQLRGRA